MIKVLVLIITLTSQTHAADYFFCKNSSSPRKQYIISYSGISFYEDGQLIYHRPFHGPHANILRAPYWNETLSDEEELLASSVPSAYGEHFEARYKQTFSSATSYIRLACKRAYRFIGRP